MTITESIKFNKLKEENEALKEQLEMAHYFNQNLGKELAELKQQILFKEDFKEFYYCINCGDGFSFDRCLSCGWKRIIDLKDSSLYDKLPSKDVK